MCDGTIISNLREKIQEKLERKFYMLESIYKPIRNLHHNIIDRNLWTPVQNNHS
jgi:hypothetical protein